MPRKPLISAAMLDLMARREHHAWTLEDLQAALAGHGAAANFSTVFRAAEKLAADGLVVKLLLDDGRARFELVEAHHDHLHCTECDELVPVPCVIGGGQASALEAETGIAIQTHQVIFEGLCPRLLGGAAMIDLWNPAHVSLGLDLVTAFLLGLVHGVTPDEHTWPITFSYAVGGYSTRAGLRAGLIFSAAFTVQQGVAGELAYLGFTKWFTFDGVEDFVYIIVGAVMVAAGIFITKRGVLHRHHSPSPAEIRDLKPWMPAVHGFIAGWGFDAFSTIIYTVLSPAMPSAATAWLPGTLFGLGTLCVQAGAGAAFGLWAARRGLPASAVRGIGLLAASRTLFWGGCAFIGLAIFDFAFPSLADIGVTTGWHVHNLHRLGLPVLVTILVVAGVGMTSLVTSTYAWRRQQEAGP